MECNKNTETNECFNCLRDGHKEFSEVLMIFASSPCKSCPILDNHVTRKKAEIQMCSEIEWQKEMTRITIEMNKLYGI